MTEPEVKAALNSNRSFYLDQPTGMPDLHYLVAETEAESYVFTFINDKNVAFSVLHPLPPGQLPFLPQGQQPTVSVLRGLISKQTWAPAEVNKGDAWWFSDAAGAPVNNGSQCRPVIGDAWLPLGTVQGAHASEHPARSTDGLMKPALIAYPSDCGVSIHLNQMPAENEDSVVTSVRYQVLDIKAINAFLKTHPQSKEK
jgi:hypothetical protein